MFTQIIDPMNSLTLTCLVALIPVVFLLASARRVPPAGVAGDAARFASSPILLAVWVWKMPRRSGHARVSVRIADGHLERRLDYVLGTDPVQHAQHYRRVREFPQMADRAGQSRRARADDAVRVGIRRVARRPGRLRLSVGGGRADSDFARHLRSERDPRRRDREQRAGVVRCARCADHHARRGDARDRSGSESHLLDLSGSVGAVVAVLALLPPVGVAVSRLGTQRHARRMAARRSSDRSAISPGSIRSRCTSARICPT